MPGICINLTFLYPLITLHPWSAKKPINPCGRSFVNLWPFQWCDRQPLSLYLNYFNHCRTPQFALYDEIPEKKKMWWCFLAPIPRARHDPLRFICGGTSTYSRRHPAITSLGTSWRQYSCHPSRCWHVAKGHWQIKSQQRWEGVSFMVTSHLLWVQRTHLTSLFHHRKQILVMCFRLHLIGINKTYLSTCHNIISIIYPLTILLSQWPKYHALVLNSFQLQIAGWHKALEMKI